MNKIVTTALLLIFLATNTSLSAADGSYKQWRAAMKAAEQARYQRDFQKMREILEASAPDAVKHGPLSSAENAFWLVIAYQNLHMHQEGIATFNKELDRIGPRPTAVKLQVIRGVLLTYRGLLYYEVRDYDNAMASATEGKTVLENVAGKYHPELFEAHAIIGRIHRLRKNHVEAEKSLQTALKLAQVKPTRIEQSAGDYPVTTIGVGNPSPMRVVIAATELGDFYLEQQKLDDAHEAFTTAYKSARASYPKDSLMRLLPLRNLAEIEYKRGNQKEFNKRVDEIFEVVTKTPGLQPENLGPLWAKLSLDVDSGNDAQAAQTARRIAKVYDVQNYEYSDFGSGGMALAEPNKTPDWNRAEKLQKALTQVAESYRAAEPAKSGTIYVEMARFAERHGKPEQAASFFEQALKSQQNAKDKGLLIGLLGKMAEDKIAAGKKAEALPLYRQVSVAMREKYGNDTRVADAIDVEANLMKELGDEEGANRRKAEAMEVRKKVVGR
jgi:tetratricopeptide (TPR) repeat protein